MIYFVAAFLVTPNPIFLGGEGLLLWLLFYFWFLATSILLSLSQILCSRITFDFLSSAISAFMEATSTLAKEKK